MDSTNTRMKAGFFSADMTPYIGTPRAGNYEKESLTGIAGPMKVRAAVFDNGKTKVALASIDVCYVNTRVINEALALAKELGGLSFDAYMIGATHTHSGGELSCLQAEPSYLEGAPEEITKLYFEHNNKQDLFFREQCVRAIATALIMADKRKEEALISTGSGHEEGRVFNRRLRMKNGRTYTHPGKGNPDIVDYAGPVDPEVGVLGAWRADGSLIGTVINFSCHGTCYSGASAHGDWQSFTDETIRKQLGDEVGVVILNGACGDLTQVDNLSGKRDFGLKIARELGVRVGAEALKVLVSAEPRPYQVVEGCVWDCLMARRRPSEEHVRRAWEGIRSGKFPLGRLTLFADWLCQSSPQALVRLGVIQIGNAVFASNPAEFFCSLGLEIKRRSHFPFTWIAELTNGVVGYVPNPEAFGDDGGGYETVLTGYSNLNVNAGEDMVDQLSKKIEDFQPESVAEPEGLRGSPWNMGILGPERH